MINFIDIPAGRNFRFAGRTYTKATIGATVNGAFTQDFLPYTQVGLLPA